MSTLVIEMPDRMRPRLDGLGARQGASPDTLAVVVGLPERVKEPRYPMLVVVPLTAQIGPWADASPRLYPRLPAGTPGLRRASVPTPNAA